MINEGQLVVFAVCIVYAYARQTGAEISVVATLIKVKVNN